MKCRYCGRPLTEGMLYCKYCGKEVRIVPDYNPLDDMLAEQVKVSIRGEDSDYLQYDTEQERRRARNTTAQRNTNTQRNASAQRNAAARRNTGRMTNAEREQRRRQAERRKAQKRKKRRKLLIIMFVILLSIIGISILLYQNSYTGIVKKGYKATQNLEYNEAISCFKRAIEKNDKKTDAYEGLSQVYIQQNDLVKAEDLYLNALEKQPDNYALYESCFEFYLATEQEMEIPKLLEDATEKVKENLTDYIVSVPEFSLDAEKVYDDVQQLSLTTSEAEIYYTTDGKNPSLSSTKYKEPIQLDEGENVIKVIAVNEKGIPSATVTQTYVIEFPIVDAPAVSPSTGQYEQSTTIEIKVPDGYDAYYTMNGEDPTTASTKYTGPISMPEGEILFKAILVSESGRTSGITTRNYVLDLPDEEE